MSGSAHQRRIVETAVASALKRLEQSIPSTEANPRDSPGSLGRSSVEAYAFFIVAGVYTVMSAFGSPVNFWVGCLMAVIMAGCAIHLLWSSIWTANWKLLAKITGTGIIVVTLMLVVNRGYIQTHRSPNPSVELSAIQNLGVLLEPLLSAQSPEEIHNTQVFEVDGKYPDIELDEPRDLTLPGQPPLVNVGEKNVGTGTALSTRESVGLFVASLGVSSENAIFRYLYRREQDRGDGIPSEDLGPGSSGTIPISGPVLKLDGKEATDEDRRALYDRSEVLYDAVLVGYQGRNGRMYHKELCYFYVAPQALSRKCTGHNGHG